ncbi:hypothetical protein LCGC14_0358320 [marine sediment metagenome]|uniref:Uncharacterized protein n=1 Tax=marine sediment metagenome TaxID=412755 RepID=A0A0F9VW63_9ZZZZ
MATQEELLQRRKELLLRKRDLLVQQQDQPARPQSRREQPQLSAGPGPGIRQRISQGLGIQQDILFPPLTGGVFTQTAQRGLGRLSTGIKEEGAPFVGETIGEFAGSKFGPKGRVIGAGLGRAAGQGIKQFYQSIVGSPNAPQSVKEAALGELEAFAIGAGTELASETLLRGARRVGAALGFKSSVLKPVPGLDDLNILAKRAGIDLTPAQRTVSRSIDTFEEMAENAMFGRGGIRDIKEIAQPKGVRKLVDNLMDSILPRAGQTGRGELGEIIGDVINKKNKAFKQAGAAAYKRVDRLTRPTVQVRDTFIDIPSRILDESGNPFIRTVRKSVKEEVGGALTNIGSIKKIALDIQKQRLKEGGPSIAIDDLVENILSRPNKVNFRTAHNIRSDFLELARNTPDKKARIVGLSNKVAGIIDSQMASAAKELSPEALAAWRSANAFWKTGKETFNSSVVRRTLKAIANETPDKVFAQLFTAKSPKQIRTIMKLADPLTKRRLQSAFLDDLITKSSVQIPGDVSDLRTLFGKSFIDRFETFGSEALKEVFTKDQLKNIRNVARIAKITQGKPGGAGGFLIQLLQAGPIAGAGGGLITGDPALAIRGLKAAANISGFTFTLSKLLQSPKRSKLLTDLMTVPPGTQQFVALHARLAREIVLIRRKERKEKQVRDTDKRQLPQLRGTRF